MISALLSAIGQILVFSLLPFLVYLFQKRNLSGFFAYIGLKPSTVKANGLAVLTSLIFVAGTLGLALLNPEAKAMLLSEETVTGKVHDLGFGLPAIVFILLTALFKTALAEEILFRGFIAKRLIHALGFRRGNVLQSLIFGMVHVLIFLLVSKNPVILVGILMLTALGAYIIGWLNERMAQGSILPGWIAHGLGNVISYSVVGFML